MTFSQSHTAHARFTPARRAKQTSRMGRLTLLMLAALLVTSCSGLGGEPPIVATFVPPTDAPADVTAERAAPQQVALATGAALFAENCTRCHGAEGRGDGTFVLTGQIPDPPPDFTSAEHVRDLTPAAYFEVITNGRLERLMPPWRDSLSESQRWAAAMHSYTLHYDEETMTEGAEVWAGNCAVCHGGTGAGDGERATEFANLTDLTAPLALVEQSDRAIFDLLSEPDDVHAFETALTEAERWAVAAYTRTLSLADAENIGRAVQPPAATPEPDAVPAEVGQDAESTAAAESTLSVRGRLTSGSDGGSIGGGQTVVLRIFDSQFNQQRLEATSSEDGGFEFTDVPLILNNGYIVTTEYEGRVYSSNMVSGASLTPDTDFSVTVFEPTSDSSVITVNSFVTQITASTDRLQVAQIVGFTNASDRVYSLDPESEGLPPTSVRIPLPPGAQILNTADQTNRFILSDDGQALIDTQPVFPGDEHIVHVIYALPYSGSQRFEFPLDYALQGPIRLLLQPENLQVTSELLAALGPQTMGSTTLAGYGADVSMPAGDAVRYEISGSPAGAQATLPDNLLPYVLIAIGSLSMLVAAVLFYLGRRTPVVSPSDEQLRQTLIEQIATLDDLHEKGQIDPKAYELRREELKTRLATHITKK